MLFDIIYYLVTKELIKGKVLSMNTGYYVTNNFKLFDKFVSNNFLIG